ncbi:MAG: hypothetical protein JO023_00740 [Chloroflexi bacterium]|nr:hypothetical protein [Chloroflexota bacterium]
MIGTFDQVLQPWHDFYALMGSSAAALLGLLFVSASIHLDALTGDTQLRAYETFNQFFLLLLLASVCLVPGLTAPLFAIAVLILGVLGTITQIRRRLRRQQLGFPHPWRRDLFPVLAYLLLVVTGLRLLTPTAEWMPGVPVMVTLFTASLLLISQATENAWEMLVYLGIRAQHAPDARATVQTTPGASPTPD